MSWDGQHKNIIVATTFNQHYPELAIAGIGWVARRRDFGIVGGDGSAAATFLLFARVDVGILEVVEEDSGLVSRFAKVFRFRDLGAGSVGFVVAVEGSVDGAADGIPAASLAEERVTLEDMRI